MQQHSNSNSNNNSNSNTNNKLSLISNEQLLQHRLSMDAGGNAVASSNFSALGVAMKARNYSSTPSDLDEDSDAPTPPKLRVSNSLTNETMPTALNSTTETIENNRAPATSSPLPLAKTYEHTMPLSLPPHNNNIADADEEDSHLSENSAIKAAFVLQQKEFLIQQQIQQQQQQQQQQHHLSHHQHQHLHQHLYDDEHSFDQQYQRSLQYPDVGYLHEADNNGSRQRKERMSKRQKELYVEFLEQNPIVNSHRRNDPILDGFWLRLANILNDCPNGAAKSVAEWKQAFDNWRYRVFLYARHNSQLNGEDAQLNSKAFKPLTLTDKRAYNLWIRNPDTAPANIEKLPTDLNCSED